MSTLPFQGLKPYRPRTFVPPDLNFSDWSAIEPCFDFLDQQAPQCLSAAELEKWIGQWGELSAALDEEASRRYILMTCHTDDAEAEKSYLQYVEEVEPKLKPRQFKLSKLYMDCPARSKLSQERYQVFDRNTALSVELFREENVPLETE